MASSSRNPLVVGRVIGDILDPFESSVPLVVTYGNINVTNGRELKPSQVDNQPQVNIGGNHPSTFYTLVITLDIYLCYVYSLLDKLFICSLSHNNL
jgi:protein FLOWERING LOCUS T